MKDSGAQRTDLLTKFRQMAEREGAVPGLREFLKETGAKKHLWDGEVWASWRAFVTEAGFTPNELTRAAPDDALLHPLAELTREHGRYPSVRELKFGRASGRHKMPTEKAYRTRFKNQAGAIAALRAWVAGRPGYEDVRDILDLQPEGARPSPVARSTEAASGCVLSDGFVPPVVDCIAALAAGDPSIVAQCAERGADPNVEFERRVGTAMSLLGFDVSRLGQGAGRAADGIARCRPMRFAVVYDAKVRRGGFSMGTEDRKFREYVEQHGRELEQEGIETLYFAVVSSSFTSRDLTPAQALVHQTKAKAVVLVEAEALHAMVDLKLRTRVLAEWAALRDLFGMTRIVDAGCVRRLDV
jgi:hypothetical protein